MKRLVFLVISCLMCVQLMSAELRTFTNKEGKKIKAELISVEEGSAVLKISGGRKAKVPMETLSVADRDFIAEWWEKNKNKLDAMKVRLIIDKNSKTIDRKTSKSGGRNNGNQQGGVVTTRTSKVEVQYMCVLESFARKDISDVSVEYTIYKRVSTKDKTGTDTDTEEIDGEDNIRLLESHGKAPFETDVLTLSKTSQYGGKDPRSWNRETIVGFVVTLKAGGEVFLKQSHPENFLDRLEEERKREEERDDARRAR
jgi:hypothetical protein